MAIFKKLFKKKSFRKTKEYRDWKNSVKKRDKKCMKCGATINLHVHHIYNYKDYPLLRIDINNGITLCGNCHTEYHSKFGKNSNPIDLYKFLRQNNE